jgi:hypothetical protein
MIFVGNRGLEKELWIRGNDRCGGHILSRIFWGTTEIERRIRGKEKSENDKSRFSMYGRKRPWSVSTRMTPNAEVGTEYTPNVSLDRYHCVHHFGPSNEVSVFESEIAIFLYLTVAYIHVKWIWQSSWLRNAGRDVASMNRKWQGKAGKGERYK